VSGRDTPDASGAEAPRHSKAARLPPIAPWQRSRKGACPARQRTLLAKGSPAWDPPDGFPALPSQRSSAEKPRAWPRSPRTRASTAVWPTRRPTVTPRKRAAHREF